MLPARPPSSPDAAAPDISDPSRLIDILVTVLPPAAAVLAAVTNVVNLWLAERIVKISGRLRRPASDLPAMRSGLCASPRRRRGRGLVAAGHRRHLGRRAAASLLMPTRSSALPCCT